MSTENTTPIQNEERWFAGIRGLHSHDDPSQYRMAASLGVPKERCKIFFYNEYAAVKKFCYDHPGLYLVGYSAGAATGAIVIKQLMSENGPLPTRADLYAPYGPSIVYFRGLPTNIVNIWPDASSGQIPATGIGQPIKGSHFEIPRKLANIMEEQSKLANSVGNPEYDDRESYS